jgi:hypothetical protein
VPKTCKGKCGRKISYQNKTGYCKECFGRLFLALRVLMQAGEMLPNKNNFALKIIG